ncbi:hypothetical protein J1605_014671, partial [Eschrichtius robustus]
DPTPLTFASLRSAPPRPARGRFPSRPWSLPVVLPRLLFTSCPAHWHLPFRPALRLRSPYHVLDPRALLRALWCRFTPVPPCGADSGAASSRYAAGWSSYGAAGGSGRQVRAGEGTREDEALRKARREQQLVSKRLLRDEALEEAEEGCVAMIFGEAEIQQFLRLAQRGTEEKEREGALVSLRRGLQRPETQQTFIRLEGSIRTLVGLLTSNQALLQLEAARCLHELSHSEQSAVVEACLPATSYLLTYLSGHSSDFIELCLYTLGNLIVESEAVRRQLLPQGIVPALAACIQSPHLTVLEALGYALSQLLQAKEAPEKIIPSASTDSSVLGSTLPQHMLQLLQPGPKLNLGVAVEFAWCLHYIICSQVNNALLITQGALSTLGLLLLDLAGAVQRTEDAGLELLACPVLRCLSNLLTEAAAEAVGGQLQLRDERVVAALFILLQFLLQKQPSLLPEGLWLLNNLTANSPSFCTSLLSLDLIEPLLHLLSVSNVVSVLVGIGVT